MVEFKCLGHHKSYHNSGRICSDRDICLGHATHPVGMEWTFHGDPKRNQRFWVYPAKDNIITPRWDFRVNPCNNSKKLSGIFSSKDEYQCLGHHSSQVTIKKKGGELWKKVLIGVGIGIGVAAVGVAAAVVINEILEQ